MPKKKAPATKKTAPAKARPLKTAPQEPPKAMLTVYIMGKAHRVPADATIMCAI